jgi:hypothetical protein
MNFKYLTSLLILVIILPLFGSGSLTAKEVNAQTSPLYIGVDVAFESIADTERLIDNLISFTNFFVIGCTGNYDETRLTTISQYVYDKGLTFIVYTDDTRYPSKAWLETAQKWGNSFLGIYFYDEPGGKQLDQQNYPLITKADNYSDASSKYVSSLSWWLKDSPKSITKSFGTSHYQLFTSDYSLYWYDYLGGYDTVFAEFAQNYSRELNIDLCRGAAMAQSKDWGVMITHASSHFPYLESGEDLYKDMLFAYDNGAKYIIIFDSDPNWTKDILQPDQLTAMQQFWQYTKSHPRSISPTSERSAYVLPQDYAYGFRSPTEDKIWGLWSNDSLTLKVSMSMASLFQIFGKNLDIIYPYDLTPPESLGYKMVVYWNDLRLIPAATTEQTPNQNSTSQPTQPLDLQPYNSTLICALVASLLIAISIGAIVTNKRNKRELTESKPKVLSKTRQLISLTKMKACL